MRRHPGPVDETEGASYSTRRDGFHHESDLDRYAPDAVSDGPIRGRPRCVSARMGNDSGTDAASPRPRPRPHRRPVARAPPRRPPGRPLPPPTARTQGRRPYELLPDLGRIGAQAGFVGAVSWNPYSVGQGYEIGGLRGPAALPGAGRPCLLRVARGLRPRPERPLHDHRPHRLRGEPGFGGEPGRRPGGPAARAVSGAARRDHRPEPPAGLPFRAQVHDQVPRPRPPPALFLRGSRHRRGDHDPGPGARREPAVPARAQGRFRGWSGCAPEPLGTRYV